MTSRVLTIEVEFRGIRSWIVRGYSRKYPTIPFICRSLSAAMAIHEQLVRDYDFLHTEFWVDFDDGLEIREYEDDGY